MIIKMKLEELGNTFADFEIASALRYPYHELPSCRCMAILKSRKLKLEETH